MSDLTDSKTEKVAQIIGEIYPETINDLLVVGCGSGIEAAILAQQLKANVTGIDVGGNFDERAVEHADLRIGDAMALDFRDESFDFVFSYHALEHISDPHKALLEMHRVLKDGGGFWIGTPNKSRIAGYIGGKDTSFKEKLQWNFADWKARLTGRFENALGAHAGFTGKELDAILSDVFSVVDDRTELYFRSLYSGKKTVFSLIERSGISRFIYPSVYFSGRK